MIQTIVTGMGVVSTAGFDLKCFWKTLVSGKITYSKIDEFLNNSNYRVTVGARITGNSWNGNIPISIKTKYGKASNYAVSAAKSALDDAGLKPHNLPIGRTAVAIGTIMGEIQAEEEITKLKVSKGINGIPLDLLQNYKTDNIAYSVKEAFNLVGPVYTVPAACAAGTYAIALGKWLIDWGYADVVIAGGVDVFSHVAFTGFQRLLSLSPDLCKPFALNRKGLVVGEGSGIIVMEKSGWRKCPSYDTYGRILGVGLTSDRYHMTAPHPEGDGAVRSISHALNESGISPGQIDYISAHGTGTKSNDVVEVKALTQVFDQLSIPPISSIKSMLGHSMGAAGALELIASFLMLKEGVMLPTINYDEPDPECPVDCVPNNPRKLKMRYILSNSFEFGGQSSSIVIGRGLDDI